MRTVGFERATTWSRRLRQWRQESDDYWRQRHINDDIAFMEHSLAESENKETRQYYEKERASFTSELSYVRIGISAKRTFQSGVCGIVAGVGANALEHHDVLSNPRLLEVSLLAVPIALAYRSAAPWWTYSLAIPAYCSGTGIAEIVTETIRTINGG